MNVAIIPARGGSKRIPRKNIKMFCGRSIIVYSIQAALESELFDEVMVSTDDEEIASVARQHGASVPFMRSAETSGDYATTADVLLEVLGAYSKFGKTFDYVCCIYPTAPFVDADKLGRAMEMLLASDADSLVPIVAFSYPPLRGLTVNNGKLVMKWPEYSNMRSQDIQQLYHDSGQFYIIRTAALISEETLFAKNTVPLILSELEVQDIDSEADWKLAEMKYRLMQGG